jgi:Sulfotransferase domain
MDLEVIGAGFGRTGTMSLKVALEELGFGPCYHMREVFEHPEHIELWEAAMQGKPVD